MLTQDQYRPKFHFSPPFGWMNDPNGLIYFNNEYHLFYQYNPFDTVWGPMHWGHAVSTNLTDWHHFPIALAPDESGACFSGSAVIDANNVTGLFDDQPGQQGILAFYTANLDPQDGTPSIQSQHIAYSPDGGKTLKKYSPAPVIANPGIIDFRDPKVIYHKESNAWIMVLSEGQDIGIYRSEDLRNWEKASVFGSGFGAHDTFAWECPDLFPIIDEQSGLTYWALIIGVQQCGPNGGTGTQYFIGSFDGHQFVPMQEEDEVLWLDHGRDFYATQSWAGLADNHHVAVAWMSNGLYNDGLPTLNWKGNLTMPRELTLQHTDKGPRLASHIPAEWTHCEEPHIAFKNHALTASQSLNIEMSEDMAITHINLNMGQDSQIEYRPFGDDSIIYKLTHHTSGYQLITERNIADNNGKDNYLNHFSFTGEVELAECETLDLTHIKDTNSSELLLCNGLYALTNLVFSENPSIATITCIKGEISVKNISLKPIVK